VIFPEAMKVFEWFVLGGVALGLLITFCLRGNAQMEAESEDDEDDFASEYNRNLAQALETEDENWQGMARPLGLDMQSIILYGDERDDD